MTVTRKPDHTKKTFKTIACGNAGCFGVAVVTNARAYYTTRAAAGALAPGIPHALFGRKVLQDSGISRRGIAQSCLEAPSVQQQHSVGAFSLPGKARLL